MAYSIRLPDGSLVENIPDEITPEAAKAKLLSLRPELGAVPKPAPSKERTFGEAAADVGAGLVGGAGKLIQLPGQLYGLATGDFSETGSLGLGKKIEQAGEEMKSAGLKAREQERAEKIAEAEKKGQISAFGTALGETLKDPGLLLNFLAEQAPQLLVPFGAGRVGSALTAGRAGTRAAIGAGAVQQGADIGTGSYEAIYKELLSKDVSEADAKQSALNLARASGASGAVISLLAQKLPGAKRLEEAMAGVPSKTGRVRGAIGTAAGETLGEIPEEVGGKFTQNLAMREVKPEQELTAGLGETAAMAAIGGAGMGGAAGLARGRAKPEVKPEVPEVLEAKRAPEEPPTPEEPVIERPSPVEVSQVEIPRDIQAERIAQEQRIVDGRRAEELIGKLEGRESNQDLLSAARQREAQAVEQQKVDMADRANEIVATSYSADPALDMIKKSRALDEIGYELTQNKRGELVPQLKRETTQTTPTTKGEEDVARLNEPTSGTGVPVPVRAANELPAAEGIEGIEQRGVDGARPTTTEPAGGAGVQPTPIDKRKLYKEPEPIKGEPMPLPTEVAAAEKDIEAIEKLRRKVETREKGPSLFKKIRGTLSRQEMSELTDAPKNIFVAANSEKKGALLTDLVADGYFDDFLPYGNKATDPSFDESSATEYIKDKIRNRNYLSYATEQEIKQLNGSAAQLREVVAEHARIEEANALAQEATEEGRNEVLESSEKGAAVQRGIINVDGVDRPTTNSNGQAIHPTEEGVRNFWRWFGDSRVVDADGKPLVVYHGTTKSFDVFGSGTGYFTADAFESNMYGGFNDAGANVMPAYLSIKSPRVIESETMTRTPRDVISDALMDGNIDGVIVTENGKVRWAVVTEPTQIKSATGNNGTYDPSNPDIRYQSVEPSTDGYKIDPQEQAIEKELAGKNFMQVAQWAVRNAPNAFAKVIAQKVLSRLQGMQARGVKFDFQIKGGGSRPGNLYGARGLTNFVFGKTGEDVSIKITLNGATVMENQDGYPSGMNYVTVLHELLHAATRGQLKYLKSTDPLVKELNDLRNQVVRQFNNVDQKDMTPFMKRVYNREINALNDIDEMVSWGMTDQDMQRFLSEIKVGEKSVFTKLIETIRKILGLGQPYESALDRLVRTTESILDESVEVIGNQIESQGYSFGTKKGKKSSGAQQSLFSKKAQEIFGEEFALGVKEVKEKVRGALQKQKPISAEAMSDLDPNLINALNKQFKPENKTFIDKAEGFKEDMWKKLAQGIADQYRSIKDYSEEAYMMARMSKSVDGALQGILFHGQVFNDGGALNIKQNTKGLIEAMKPLGKDVDRYQMWVALNRDARLPKEKRSFDPDLVAKRDQLAQGTLNGKPRLEVFKEVQGDMNALNKSVLDVAYKSGLINLDAYKIFSNDIFYIPFYKQMEDGDIQGASTASGLVGQKFSNQLKGGEKQLGDLMENTLLNWSHILSSSMKNQAANETIKAAEKLDAATPNLKSGFKMENGRVYSIKNNQPIKEVLNDDGTVKYSEGEFRGDLTTSDSKNVVKVMRNGEATYFKVLDPMLLDSIMSIGYMGPKSKFLDVAKDFKNILQFGVTISPAFKVRNLFRDSISALALTDLPRDPVANVINGWNDSDKNNPAHISALAGGAIFNFGSTVEGDQAKLTKRLIKEGVREQDILDTPEKIKEGLKYIWDKYQEFGNKSESANRMALYSHLIKNGKTHLEASFYARDMLDFSMQGSFGTIRTLAQVVPFFNARVQGLYKLGRDGILPTGRVVYNTITGKPIWDVDEQGRLTKKGERQKLTDQKKAESFSIVTSAVALASMALYLGFKDDEEFQKREAWDRDNFWWFKLPGMEYAVRIPKPFEIGAFGTIAERTLEQIIDQGAEGKQFGDSLSRMLWDTFSMNPMPQVFKPLVDLYANKDSFTGAPIESAGMERLSKQERATDSTSPIAKALGGLTSIAGEGLSPVQIDYAIKAYFGWLGGSIASMSTYAVAPFKDGEYPDIKAVDVVSQGFIKSLPANQSRYVTSFYENNQQVNQAFADMRHYAELGDSEKVQKIMEEKGDLIALQKLYDKTAKNMANVRKQIRVITDDKEMDGATKREEIDRLKQLISMMAEQAESIRKSTKS
jgi:hypothetical protein